MALGDDQGRWYLVNAPPDLPVQIEKFPPLQPRSKPCRNTPIAGVLLTNADLDHTLGLFSLREGGCLNLYASPPVRAAAGDCLGLGSVLDSFCGARWHDLPTQEFAPLAPEPAGKDGVRFRAIELLGGAPPFARDLPHGLRGAHSVAYQFLNPRTGRRLLVAPDVAALNPGLAEALQNSDVVLFDGTFWSQEELAEVRPNARRAEAMGHLTIKEGSLELLAALPAKSKAYLHINNTNPILAAHSPERAAVEAAGLIVGADGMEFDL